MTILRVLKCIFLGWIFAFLISCKNLKGNEVAKVEYEYYGDFGFEISQLILFESGDSTFARLESKDKIKQERSITQSQLSLFRDFVADVRSLDDSGGYCTSSISCKIYTQAGKISKENIWCGWRGFDKLKSNLGFTEQ